MSILVDAKSEEVKQIIEGVLNLSPDEDGMVYTQVYDVKHEHRTFLNSDREDDDYYVYLRGIEELHISIHELELIGKRLSKLGLRCTSLVTEEGHKLVLNISSFMDCGCSICMMGWKK